MSQAVLEYVQSVITEEMNFFLSRDFDTSKVDAALQQIAPLKAPRPDGMLSPFYQHFWGTMN